MSKYILPEPPITPSTDLEAANHENYLAWKLQSEAHKRCMTTLFNAFQGRSVARLCQHKEWEEDTLHDVDALKDDITRRLTRGCTCEPCRHEHEELREKRLEEEERENKRRRSSVSAVSQRSSDSVDFGDRIGGKSPTRALATPVSAISSTPPFLTSTLSASASASASRSASPPSAPENTQVGALPRSRHHRRSSGQLGQEACRTS